MDEEDGQGVISLYGKTYFIPLRKSSINCLNNAEGMSNNDSFFFIKLDFDRNRYISQKVILTLIK